MAMRRQDGGNWRSAGLAVGLMTGLALASAARADEGAPSRAPAVERADPWALYAAGEFADAARQAAARQDADSLALAAKAVAADYLLNPQATTPENAAARVRAHAEAALARDPDHIEAQLHLAVALWLEGRAAGPFESYVRKLPAKGRDVLRAALSDAPDEAWAHALMGAWHFEVVRRGGGAGARLYGAGVHEGVEHFYRAMRLEPDNAAIAFQCALAFLALDSERYADHANAALQVAQRAEADDAFEAEMIRRSEHLLALMAAHEDERLRREVARWTAG